MKNRKGYIPTTAMMIVLTLGSTIANAGIVITGRAEPAPPPCEQTTTEKAASFLTKVATFATTGIVITGRASTECTDRNGIVITG